MERLTEVTIEDGVKLYDISEKLCLSRTTQGEKITTILKKLADYEDLEEQGMLIKLPCKVGDTVYYFSGSYYKNIKYWEITPIIVTEFSTKANRSGKIMPFSIIANGTRYPMSSIGRTVFLTREEAEAELKKLRGEDNADT